MEFDDMYGAVTAAGCHQIGETAQLPFQQGEQDHPNCKGDQDD